MIWLPCRMTSALVVDGRCIPAGSILLGRIEPSGAVVLFHGRDFAAELAPIEATTTADQDHAPTNARAEEYQEAKQ